MRAHFKPKDVLYATAIYLDEHRIDGFYAQVLLATKKKKELIGALKHFGFEFKTAWFKKIVINVPKKKRNKK